MPESDEVELTDAERAALHELQLGIENLYRGYGNLLGFHHTIGRGMDHLHNAEAMLREAGHTEQANSLRDDALPIGIFEDTWSYEMVEAFKREFLTEVSGFEREIREELADGKQHITERRQQHEWHERATDRSDE